MFLKLFLTVISISVILFSSEGTRVEKTTRVNGYGMTRSAAIEDALIEAVKQKNGAYIASVKQSFSAYSQNSISVNNTNVNITKANDVMVQKIRVATKGYIDSYDIDDIIKRDDGYKAIVNIHTVEYKTPGYSANNRRKIVIVPTYTENIAFRVLNHLKSMKNVSYNLTQYLIDSITQTRKFSVLDRENKQAYSDEARVILSPDANKDEILKLGKVLGTDYLVVSTIKEFKIIKKKTMIRSIGQEVSKLKAYAVVHYQILTMATRQVKWSNTLNFEFTPKGKNEQQIFYNTIKKISTALTTDIIDNIYPLRISKVSLNGDAIIMQSTKLGTIYDVYALGDKLYDPYTKEFLGYDEIKTGKIKIVRSLAKVSYGKVIEGEIQPNSICRKAKNIAEKDVKVRKREGAREGNYNKGSSLNHKKSIVIKSLSISNKIDRYKYKYIKDANIELKIKDLVNKSKEYRVLTRDKQQAQAMMDENAFSNSDISESMDKSSMTFANTDYQLLPKVTKFKFYTSSVKIPDIDAYDNRDYIKMELNIVVINRKGEVIFESTKSGTYSKSWSSSKKLKRKRPSYRNVSKLANKIVAKVLYDLLNKKAQLMNQRFITVVEVDKKSIYLDMGGNKNIQEGELFPVYREPKVKIIKRTSKTRLSYGDRIATVKISGIYEDGAEAVVVKGKISNIKEGDVLRVKIAR